MKKYLIALIILLIASVAFGNASNLTRVTDADAKTFVKRAGMTLDDFGGASAPMTSGTAYYVDSVNGADNRDGKSWDLPLATIDAAINLISAARTAGTEKGRSIIYIREQHAMGGTSQTVVGGFDADIAGITLWGLGSGSDKPNLVFDYASTTATIGADNVTFYNLRFIPSTSSITTAINIESGADYAKIINCDFGYLDARPAEFTNAITMVGSYGTQIVGNYFDALENSAVSAIYMNAAATDTLIKGNYFHGDYSTSVIYNKTAAQQHIRIEDNVLYQGVHGGLNTLPVITLLTGSTGYASNNKVIANLANTSVAFNADGAFFFENFYNEDTGGSKTAYNISLVAATTTSGSINLSAGN